MLTSRKFFLKVSLLFVFFTIAFTEINGQGGLTCSPPSTPCTYTPYNGNINIADPPSTSLYTIPSTPLRISYAKDPESSLFRDVKYINDNNYAEGTTCDTTTGDSDSCLTTTASLIYDVYYPNNYSNYSTCPLPAVILFHAGGFMECSNLSQPGIQVVCEELAKRGYVAFSVEYREGRITDPANPSLTTVQQQLAVYKACQDARGAIRSIIKRQNNEGIGSINDPYRINVDKIFVGGFSAGAVAAINASWYSNSMVYSVFPNGGTGSSTIKQALGDIDIDFYYASPTDVPDYQSKIVGNACMWGAVSIPPNYETLPLHEYDFFDSSLLKPLISFQGKLDDVFPYPLGSGQQVKFSTPPLFGPNIYNSEDFCVNTTHGPFFLDGNPSNYDLVNGSTLNMRNILLHYGIADEHYLDCDMHHGLTSNGVFEGDFGTSATNSHDASVYIAERIATFFQAVLNGIQGSIGTNYFPNCENTRKACNAKTTSCTDCP